jgi:penicillin-binding protein 2B
MMQTHVIDKIVDPVSGETIKETKPEVVGSPISEKTAAQVRDYLETVISGEDGSGKKYAIEGYGVAGKTGTAQIPGNGGYLRGSSNYIFSFLGMAPKDDPELIMYVAVQQPKVTSYEQGSTPVSMIFKPVMKNSLQYLQIEPSDTKPVETVITPNVIDLSTDQAMEKLKNQGLEAVLIGNGSKIVSQIPMENESLLAGERVMLKTDAELTAPDMMGWSIRDVMKVAEVANMKLNSVGNGFVVKQNVTAGSTMKEGDYLIVELNRPSVQTKSESETEAEAETKADVGTNADEVVTQD